MVQVGAKTGSPLNFVGRARCDGTALPADVPLIGVQVGAKSGVPLIAAGCVECVTDPGERTIDCTGGLCDGEDIVIPGAGLVLSITEIADVDGLTMPTGDIDLVWTEDVVTNRELDQSESPCLETTTTTDGYFSEEYYIGVYLSCDIYIRYWYDVCPGVLKYVYRGCNADCPDNNDPVQSTTIGTLTVSDCNPYYADISDSPDLVASVAI
jgi:hypothetical protein